MAPGIRCTIRTTDGAAFSGEARAITLPTRAGEVQVRLGHADAFIAVASGDVVIEDGNGALRRFTLGGGIFRIKDDAALLVA